MKYVRTKARKISRILCAVPCALLTLFYLTALILGEETVMGSPVLHAMWKIGPYILLLWIILASIAAWILLTWEKKHPPKEDDPFPQDGEQHPPTD